MTNINASGSFERTELIIGKRALETLRKSCVIIFGLGGVGGHALEALVRSGVGSIDIVDSDTVDVTNLNRQLLATSETVGELKVDVAEHRMKSIMPDISIRKFPFFYDAETADEFDFEGYDYVIDAIDSVSSKIELILRCQDCGTPVISAMGCGNRMNPSKLYVTDIYRTSMDPLAKVIRRELRTRGVKKLKVVCSSEQPIKPKFGIDKKRTPGSTAFVPGAAGLLIASEVVRDLILRTN